MNLKPPSQEPAPISDEIEVAPETSPIGPTSQEPSTCKEISREAREEIVRLKRDLRYGTRKIAKIVVLSRKVVRRILMEEGCLSRRPPPARPDATSKVTPFLEPITARVLKDLTVSRILREICEMGYQGRRTILAAKVREIRAQHQLTRLAKKVTRRFETDPGQEMQTDWSPYKVLIAGELIVVHILSVLLCHSRKLFVTFFRDERQHSLLEGIAMAFEYFGGCAIELVLDNMTTAVLGRISSDRKPLWHPMFEQFVAHYGVSPFACAVRHPDRKGKEEKAFRLIQDDFLRGSEFRSWDHLLAEGTRWLDETPDVANQRIHGTTGERPNEAFLAERDFLIRLPRERFPVFEDSQRIVDADSTLSVDGRKYSIPSRLANRSVSVRLFGHHFEVIEPGGGIAFSRTYAGPEEKRKLLLDETHYAGLPRRPRSGRNGARLDEAFLRRFPELAALVDGLKIRMKTLAPIHIRQLIRHADQYGREPFLRAATRAQEFRRFDAQAVSRILADNYPDGSREPVPTLNGSGVVALGEVDQGSLDEFGRLDIGPPSPEKQDTPTPPDDSTLNDKEKPHGS